MVPYVTATLFAALTCWQVSQASPLAAPQTTKLTPDQLLGEDPLAEGRGFRVDRLTKSGVNCWIAQDPDCWDEMEMDQYVAAWAAGPKALECGTQGVLEGFGDCFIRLHQMGVICSAISDANCGTDTNLGARLIDHSELVAGNNITDLEKRQAFFCATNLVAMNAFFNTWHTAASTALSLTADQVTAITTIAAPPPQAQLNAWKAGLVNALLAGLAFLPGISGASTLLSTAARTVKTFEAPGRILLAASSSVFARIFPTDGSAESNLQNIGTLTKVLSDFVNDVTARLQPALDQSINNVTAFRQMASTGAFSGEFPPRLDNATLDLSTAIRTYIASVALNSAGWYGVVAPNTNVPQLLSGASGKPNLNYGCTAVDPATNRCNAIWWDAPNNQGFTLVQGSSVLNNPFDKFTGLLDAAGGIPITTPESLLVGAAKCRLRAGWGTVAPAVTLDEGEINFDCMSQLKICTYNTACTADTENCKYLESDCPVESGFGYNPRRVSGAMQDDSDYEFKVEPG
ncbi:MAG: hypothetical protein Q9168_006592, partial [Polycauliona sp. 1 TL-2023]